MLVESLMRITHVVPCPVTADIEAGYGNTPEDVLQTVRAVIEAGAVGINIEDPTKEHELTLVESSSFSSGCYRVFTKRGCAMTQSIVTGPKNSFRREHILFPTVSSMCSFVQGNILKDWREHWA